MKRLDYYLRDLAKSDYWQTLYGASQKHSGIRMFENESDFSSLQVQFLQWLSVYNMLYQELAEHESKHLTGKVLEDYDRTDAYLYMRRKQMDLEWKKYQKDKEKQEIDAKFSKKKNIGKDSDFCDVQFKG